MRGHRRALLGRKGVGVSKEQQNLIMVHIYVGMYVKYRCLSTGQTFRFEQQLLL